VPDHAAASGYAQARALGFEIVLDSTIECSDGRPYPALTDFGAASVGTLSIRRFMRPVCHQNMPADPLPDDFN
jgi:2,5-dioxopentanoate dehydrogenase